MKAILTAIFFSLIAQISFAQSSSIDAVHKVNENLYCTAISGDRWATITFSNAPGKQSRLAYSPVVFKNEFFHLEFHTAEKNGGGWSIYGNKEKFKATSEVTMKECIRALNYDGHFDWVQPKPSTLFAKATVKDENIHKPLKRIKRKSKQG